MMIIRTADPAFEETLRVQLRLERLQAVRDLLLNILAFDGVLVWLDVIWPRQVLRLGGSFAALMWPICFAFFVVTQALEHRAKTRLDRLAEAGAGRMDRPSER
jgi:hypothetical protein